MNFKQFKPFTITTSRVIYTLIIGILLTAGVFSFLNVGSWLYVSNPLPQKLDIILTFAGENVRVAYSKELLSKNPGSYWMLSDYKDGYSRLLRKSNYDMSRVIVVDTCKSTFSEINALDTWLRANSSTFLNSRQSLSVGLVSSPYHMRRIKIMVEQQFKNSTHRFFYLPVPFERYNWNAYMFRTWWKSESISRVVFSEIQKIFYFLVISYRS